MFVGYFPLCSISSLTPSFLPFSGGEGGAGDWTQVLSKHFTTQPNHQPLFLPFLTFFHLFSSSFPFYVPFRFSSWSWGPKWHFGNNGEGHTTGSTKSSSHQQQQLLSTINKIRNYPRNYSVLTEDEMLWCQRLGLNNLTIQLIQKYTKG